MNKLLSITFLPVLILIILVIMSLIATISSSYIINQKFYIGLLCLSFSILSYLKNEKLFIFIFAITLTLVVVDIIEFFYIDVRIGISDILFINPIYLIVLVLFLFLNKDNINRLFPQKK